MIHNQGSFGDLLSRIKCKRIRDINANCINEPGKTYSFDETEIEYTGCRFYTPVQCKYDFKFCQKLTFDNSPDLLESVMLDKSNALSSLTIT